MNMMISYQELVRTFPKTLYANGVSLYYISLATGLSWRVLMTELTFIASHENIRQKSNAHVPKL